MTEPDLFAVPSEDTDPLAGLNDAQLDAVTHTGSPLAVIAGPGTGKTRVITRRIAHLINEQGVAPEHIVALTFTKKAAREMRERIGPLVGTATADRLFAGTFHAFASTLLARYADLAGLPANPTPTDSALQRRMMRELVRVAFDSGRTHRDMLVEGVESITEKALKWCGSLANDGIQPGEAQPLAGRWRALADHAEDDEQREGILAEARAFELYAWLYELFAEQCLERRLASYDDLVLLPSRLLEQSELARSLARDAHRWIVVDEFQDVNHAQIRLLRAIAPPDRSPELCVVGDDDQAIYGFRGATDLAFQTFASTWHGAHTVTLEENHRSSAAILDASNATISSAHARAAPDKLARPMRVFNPPAPDAIECVDLPVDNNGFHVIAAMLREARALNPERRWYDSAVICRGNSAVAEIAEGLRLAGIPTESSSDIDQRSEPAVADLLAWIELLSNPDATWSATRLLLRPPFGVEIDRVSRLERTYRKAAAERETLGELATDTYPQFLAHEDDDRVRAFVSLFDRLNDAAGSTTAGEAIRRIMEETGLATADLPEPGAYARRVRLLASIVRFADTRARFFDPPADLAAFWRYQQDLEQDKFFDIHDDLESDEDDDAPDAVPVMTAHKAKGLEFDTVYLPRVTHNGYSKKQSQPVGLPPEIRPGAPDERNGVEQQEDEARRLFYVACTRAERRLVLLAKPVKKRSDFNFYQEHVVGRPESVDRSTEQTVLDRAAAAPNAPLPVPVGDAPSRARVLAGILDDARRKAAEALHEAGNTPITRDRLGELASVLDRTIRVSAAARSASGGGDAESLAPAGEAAAISAMFDAAPPEHIDPDRPVIHAPQRPPLRLSYSRVSLYDKCPLCYYARYIAGLDEPPSKSLVIGNLTHKALELFYARWREADAEGRTLPALEHLLQLSDTVFAAAVREGEMLVSADRARVSALLETTFEHLHDPNAHIEQLEHVIRFPVEHQGTTHSVEARLDRIDQMPDGSIRLIDYKTGSPTDALLKPKSTDLQLGIYALAIEHDRGSCDGVAQYWVCATGQRGERSFDSLKTDAVLGKVHKAIEGLLEGKFAPKKSSCDGPCSVLRGACNPQRASR